MLCAKKKILLAKVQHKKEKQRGKSFTVIMVADKEFCVCYGKNIKVSVKHCVVI